MTVGVEKHPNLRSRLALLLAVSSAATLLVACAPTATKPEPVSGEELSLPGLFDEASSLYRAGDHAASLEPSLQALALARQEQGPDSEAADVAGRRLGHVLLGLGYPRSAETLFQQQLEADRAAWGDRHPATLLTQNNLAVARLLQGRTSESRALLEDALESDQTPYDQRLVLLNNLAYAALIEADYDSVARYRSLAIQTADTRPTAEGDGAAGASASWASYAGQSSGDSAGGPAVDCSVFAGGNGPFNPDPETGGPLADCGPFGSDPIWGGEDEWWRDHGGGPGSGGGDGDGGEGDSGPGDGGGDGFDWGDDPLSDDEKDDLPEGYEEDFNGCAGAPAGSLRDACCESVRAQCLPDCELTTDQKIITRMSEDPRDISINPFVCSGCRKAEGRCKAGKPL